MLPSEANFVFAVPPRGLAAETLYQGLLSRGLLVRHGNRDRLGRPAHQHRHDGEMDG